MGLLHAEGQGVKRNEERVVFWHLKAARQDHLPAQVNLGAMYIDGFGVARDEAHALAWWALAAQEGDERASHNLDSLRHDVNGETLARAWRLTRKLKAQITNSPPSPPPLPRVDEAW